MEDLEDTQPLPQPPEPLAVRGPGRAPGQLAPARARRRFQVAALFAAGLLAGALAAGGGAAFVFTRARAVARREAPRAKACAAAGCSRPVATASRFDTFRKSMEAEGRHVRPWTPEHCEEHTPYACVQCGRREAHRPDVCPSCGHLGFTRTCADTAFRPGEADRQDGSP